MVEGHLVKHHGEYGIYNDDDYGDVYAEERSWTYPLQQQNGYYYTPLWSQVLRKGGLTTL